MFAEGHDRHDAGQHVEHERAEVADEGDDEQAVGDLARRGEAEGPELVPEPGLHAFGQIRIQRRRRRRAAEEAEAGVHADEDGDDGQSPDGAVRGQVLAVQHPEMGAHFFIASHGVGDAGTRAHAG